MFSLFVMPLISIAGIVLSSRIEDYDRVVFILNSQPNSLHHLRATTFKNQLVQNLREESSKNPQVLILGDDLPLHGSWTYLPLFETLHLEFGEDMNWFVFLEECTSVNLTALRSVLNKYEPEDEIFLGNALSDTDSTIIHHFVSPGLKYPELGSGFVLSFKLLGLLSTRLLKYGDKAGGYPRDFSIDSSFELANFIYASHKDDEENTSPDDILEHGARLKHEPRFCSTPHSECALYRRSLICNGSQEEIRKLATRTLFAVKTCGEYHSSRLPFIRKTWTPDAHNVKYFSEVEDSEYETIVLPGVQNTLKGHCGKTIAIIKYFNQNYEKHGWDWLAIVDDDTILSVQKIMELLRCYNYTEIISLGQRYGFRVTTGSIGYDYITGGGGMIFSKTATLQMMKSPEICSCPSDDYPDDMHLGACISNLGSSVIHSEAFHQARPNDYSSELLQVQSVASFHKFWNNDPEKVYNTWFKNDNADLRQYKMNAQHHTHSEL